MTSNLEELPRELQNYLYEFIPKKLKMINRKYYSLSKRIKLISPCARMDEETIKKLPLEKIYKLSIYKPDYTKKIIKRFETLKKIKMVHNKYITNKKLKMLKHIDSLKLINDYSITDSYFVNKENIINLSIVENKILTDIIFRNLQNLQKLKINCSFDNSGDRGVDLSCLYKLEELELEDVLISNDGLNGLKNLKKLSLFNTFSVDEQINELNQLVELDIIEEKNITDNALKNMKELKKISLMHNTQITGECLYYTPKLENIDLYIFGDEENNIMNNRPPNTKDLFKNMTNIKTITDRCGFLIEDDVQYINRSLTKLFINGHLNIKIENLTNIHHLSFNKIFIHPEWFNKLKNLKSLDFYYITDLIIEDFFELDPNIAINIYK